MDSWLVVWDDDHHFLERSRAAVRFDVFRYSNRRYYPVLIDEDGEPFLGKRVETEDFAGGE